VLVRRPTDAAAPRGRRFDDVSSMAGHLPRRVIVSLAGRRVATGGKAGLPEAGEKGASWTRRPAIASDVGLGAIPLVCLSPW